MCILCKTVRSNQYIILLSYQYLIICMLAFNTNLFHYSPIINYFAVAGINYMVYFIFILSLLRGENDVCWTEEN